MDSTSAQKLQQYSDEFTDLTLERHEFGEQKYGPGTFLTKDTMYEALLELADLSNYARYTYMRIRALQDALANHPEGSDVLHKDFTKEMGDGE